MLLKVMLVYSPVAVMSLLLTCTVISVDDGLLRTSTGCAGPSSSSTLYVDWLKLTIIAIMADNYCTSISNNFLALLHDKLHIITVKLITNSLCTQE